MFGLAVEGVPADRAAVTVSRSTHSHGAGRAVVLALVVFPFFAVPVYLVGQGIADSLDDDRTNGVLALGLMLAVGLPSLASIAVGRRWGGMRWVVALALGLASGCLSLGVLLVFFLAACTAANCVV